MERVRVSEERREPAPLSQRTHVCSWGVSFPSLLWTRSGGRGPTFWKEEALLSMHGLRKSIP